MSYIAGLNVYRYDWSRSSLFNINNMHVSQISIKKIQYITIKKYS